MTTLTTMTAVMVNSLGSGSAWWSRWRQAWPARLRAVPARRSATEDAAELRALADTYRRTDPSFASDLFAAADRHERDAEMNR
jgi:hypothetical protein